MTGEPICPNTDLRVDWCAHCRTPASTAPVEADEHGPVFTAVYHGRCLTAVYHGRCLTCDEHIAPGEGIALLRDGGYVHEGCLS